MLAERTVFFCVYKRAVYRNEFKTYEAIVFVLINGRNPARSYMGQERGGGAHCLPKMTQFSRRRRGEVLPT